MARSRKGWTNMPESNFKGWMGKWYFIVWNFRHSMVSAGLPVPHQWAVHWPPFPWSAVNLNPTPVLNGQLQFSIALLLRITIQHQPTIFWWYNVLKKCKGHLVGYNILQWDILSGFTNMASISRRNHRTKIRKIFPCYVWFEIGNQLVKGTVKAFYQL